jgi:hypothetical protein
VVQLFHESITSNDLIPEIGAVVILMIRRSYKQSIVLVEGSPP